MQHDPHAHHSKTSQCRRISDDASEVGDQHMRGPNAPGVSDEPDARERDVQGGLRERDRMPRAPAQPVLVSPGGPGRADTLRQWDDAMVLPAIEDAMNRGATLPQHPEHLERRELNSRDTDHAATARQYSGCALPPQLSEHARASRHGMQRAGPPWPARRNRRPRARDRQAPIHAPSPSDGERGPVHRRARQHLPCGGSRRSRRG